MEQFNQALLIDPSYVLAYQNMAASLCDNGRTDEAIFLLQRAAALIPASAELQNSLGLCLARKGELDQALKCFQAALEIDPRMVAAARNRSAAQELKHTPANADERRSSGSAR